MWLRFVSPIPLSQLIKKTVNEIGEDNCLGLAAQLAFYFLLGLFPALLFLVALIGYVPLEAELSNLLTALGAIAPEELVELLRAQLVQVTGGGHASLLTIGALGAIWSSSAAMVAIIDALNRAFDVTEWRPWWKRRLVAIGLTMALALFIVVSMVLVLIGPALAFPIANWLQLGPGAAVLWAVLRWPVMIGCVVVGVDLIYHFAPNRRARWVWFSPGSVLATALWIISSFVFKLYLTTFGDYAAMYGAIGGAIVSMLWLYMSSLSILIGAELNGVVEAEWRRATAQPPTRCLS